MPDFFKLEYDQRRLWTWLQANALGADHAVRQRDAALALGISTRQLQDVANGMRKCGWPVISSREGRMGIFVAVTQSELDRYRATLTAIARDIELQLRVLDDMRPAVAPVERTLF